MAAIWDLPVLFVCENNQYATEIAFSDATRNPQVAARGAAYGITGVEEDGNDVVAVSDAAAEAVARAREGAGPTLLECRTYRTRAHVEGMPDTGYRKAAEVEEWRQRDPIATLKATLPAAEVAAVAAEIDTAIADAFQFAKDSPFPEAGTAGDFVFSSTTEV